MKTYEVYALRYASVERTASSNFLHSDMHEGSMPLDFYFWVIRNEDHLVVVDTGFSECSAQQRNRKFEYHPEELLKTLNINTEEVQNLVLTHLHYDHAGNVKAFPNARIHIQEAEVNFATGRYMCFHSLRLFFSADDVVTIIHKLYDDKVQFHDGFSEIYPGIEVYKIGGHTAGLQIVRVWTRRGWLVLASDAMHYYQNYEQENPFPGILDVGQMLEGYRIIRKLVESDRHIIPGHDPLVAKYYPGFNNHPSIFRLDSEPEING